MDDLSPEPSPEKPWFSNLRPMPPWNKEQAKEMGRKGGKVRSERKAVMNALKNRVWCEPKCKIYFSCPFPNMSQKQYEGKCALKKQDAKLQGMIVDLLLDPDKIIDNMKRVLADMSWEALGSFKNKAVLFDKLRDLYETIHGTKSKSQIEKRDYKFVVEVKKPKVLQEKKEEK